MKATRLLVCGLLCVGVGVALLAPAVGFAQQRQPDPFDWPHWRGPELNGISRERGLPDKWSPDGENLLWKNPELAGRSTPIVMGKRLYTIVPHRQKDESGVEAIVAEKVVCVDIDTGQPLWENRFNVFLSDVPAERVGWSSVVGDPATGHVFALGVCGYFQCIDGETGKTLWSHSLSEEYGLLSTYGGRTNFPIVDGNLVIISAVIIGWGDMAKPAHRFIAFDKRNGQPVWFAGTRLLPYDTTYSSPITTVINGQPMMIFGSGDGGVHAFQPQTGKKIWTYNVSSRGINTTPLVVGDRVYCGHGEENLDTTEMGALFCIDATKTGDITKTGEVWRVPGWLCGKSTPIYVDGRLYAIEQKGKLLIVEPETGKLIKRVNLGTVMTGSPVYGDGKIYCCTANGRWYILKPTEDGVEFVHRMRLNRHDVNGSPIISHGRIFLPTSEGLYCIGKKDHQPEADPRPQPPQPRPISENPDPALVQVVPVEAILRSGPDGQRQPYQVRLYNSDGRFLRVVDNATFSIEGPGTIDASGVYTAPEESVHAAVTVTAKVGELTGTARIRVVPALPWRFDFDDGQVPITWVGARYRHIPLDYDLYASLKQRDERAAALYIYFQTDFVNNARSEAVFNDSTPRQTWTALLRYLGLDTGEARPKTLEQAQAALDPALKLLEEEKILASHQWSDEQPTGLQLAIKKGTRGIEGNGVIVKITTIPKGTRSQAWMGPPAFDYAGSPEKRYEFRDYEIQADVLGNIRDGKLPDIGLIAQRYTLDMMGASQQLQIRTWPPQLRMAKTVSFPWKPNVWYTMKLRATVEDGKAVLRGKVWPKGQEEPAAWNVEAVDELANTIGSPGLFGNATNAEIFYDNLSVRPVGAEKVTSNQP